MATPSTTFVKVFEEWMQRDQADNKSAGKVRRIFAREVLPYWQNRDIGEITRRDVLDVVDRIVDRGALGAARKAHASLHRLFQWALGRGIVATSPTAALPKPGSDVSRDRVLADAEIVQVWPAAPELGLYGVAVQLLLLTGARREEISRLRHDEIRDGAIHLSGARTKSGEARIIPLSKPAQALVAGLPESFELKLTGWGHQKAKLDKLVQIPPWRLHDLRRTCATGLQKLGVRLEVTEAILGHTSGSRSGIVGVYQRHNFPDEKRIALEAWGAHVMALVEGSTPGKVVAFRGK
jgi:integrase